MAAIRASSALLAGLCAASATAEIRHEKAPDTGAEAWHWQAEGAEITLRQRLSVQSRAYFEARGFTAEQAEPIANSCVFQAVFRNTANSDPPIALDMGKWRVVPEGGSPRPPRLDADWEPQWAETGASNAARIAFRWSLFPTIQRFEPGDWNMGMVTLGLAPGTRFDLHVVWQRGPQREEARFTGLQCAPDGEI